MTIYVDSENRCHVNNREGYIQFETDIFENVPESVIECYKYYPANGNTNELAKACESYVEIAHRTDIADLNAQNDELLSAMASMVEDVYNQDLAEIEG